MSLRVEFDWDDKNIAHIARHEIKPEEAQEVLRNDPLLVQVQHQRGEERLLVLGRTNAGRLLVIVYTERRNKIRVITAYPMTKRLEKIYFRER